MGDQQNKKNTGLDSLAPVTIKDSIDEEAAAAMNRGKGQALFMAFFLIFAALGGLVLFIHSIDERSELLQAGKSINGLKKSHFDQFWSCALKGQNLREIRSNADLISSIMWRGSAAPKYYGNILRDKCIVFLKDLSVRLDRVQPPEQFDKHIAQIVNSTKQLNREWQIYIDQLTDTEREFDPQRAQPCLDRIAVGWYEFKMAHNQINKFLMEQL